MSENAKDEQVRLDVESPVPGQPESWFSLYFPKNTIAKEDFDIMVKHIEFRRKCMNQGFDNLIELLNMTRESMLKDAEAAQVTDAVTATAAKGRDEASTGMATTQHARQE